MNHYAVVLEYSGKSYCGWQKQTGNNPSIQSCLEDSLSKIANQKIKTFCAGRTDAGVHATSQVVSFSSNANRTKNSWILGTNNILPSDIKLVSIFFVDETFHARFSAIYRRYQYLIHFSNNSSAIFFENSKWLRKEIDIVKINKSCEYLLGKKDFSAFQSSRCQARSSIRRVYHAYFIRYGKFLIFDIKCNAFLYHMVRNIIAVLLKIGVSDYPCDWIKYLMNRKILSSEFRMAEPEGLYLVEVGYPKHYNIPSSRTLQSFLST